ncbi:MULTISPECIES: DUF3263 domain-containing protein [unclassified Streptomyces]|uniref:DUF3263 domain-containing protein n=1 Tax=unclassified Streptomyces TaxID=2593676 RepID=UPI00093A969D|nr:DUF3263 domain-containing protein [Streptomyces sp. CB01580]
MTTPEHGPDDTARPAEPVGSAEPVGPVEPSVPSAQPAPPAPSDPAEPSGPSDGTDGRETPEAPNASGLSDRDRAVLALERRSWAGPGAKERAIREQLGISPTRYYQLLNALLDDRRALEEDPVTVNRLRRVRDARRDRR